MVERCNVTRIPTEWNFRREPRRPPELRRDYFNGMRFDDNYDWDNLWYDAVQVDQHTVLLIGPNLNNIGDRLNQGCRFTMDDGTVLPARYMDLDRCGMMLVGVPDHVDHICLESEVRTIIPVTQHSTDLDGKKVIFTLQKNNPISWIRQWISYHRDVFGVDGCLIYDNGSTAYTAAELEDALSDAGITVKIVEWNVPYGPQGFDCDWYNTWDSDYAQSSMFEHAKRRYLTNAMIAINADIDELLVIKEGDLDSVIAGIKREGIAGYCYKGRWIEPYSIGKNTAAINIALDDRKFADYYCTDQRNRIGIGNKWMLIPNLALNYQWVVHSTGAPMRQTDDIYYGHYMAMNTNWSWDRDRYDRDTTDLVADMKLMHNLYMTRKRT